MFHRGTHITRDMCFLGRGTHITRDVCFLGRGTHITRHMCFLDRGRHITRDMCFLDREDISLVIWLRLHATDHQSHANNRPYRYAD